MTDTTPQICMVGSSNTDLVVRVPRATLPGETLIGSNFQIGFGGKGANQSVMAARLGARVTVVTKLGRDVFGENTINNFRQQGIDTTYVLFDEQEASGVALITVDENSGQNSIVIAPGANFTLSPADIRASRQAIAQAQVLLCQLEIRMETTIEAFRIAKEVESVVTILNPAPAAELPDELLQMTDILMPNEVEASMLTGMPTETVEQAVAAGQKLRERGVETVVMTLGSRGSLLIAGDGEPVHIPAERVQAVDTTGAGDAFVGSFAYLLASGRTLRDSVERAGAIATRSVLKTGTQSSFPMRDEVLNLL